MALVVTILRVEVRGVEAEVARARGTIAHRGPKVAIRAPIVQRAITPIVAARAIEIQWILQLSRIIIC